MSQDELTDMQAVYDRDAVFCRVCGKSVWYRNTKAHVYDGHVVYGGTSYLTKKTIMDTVYRLTCCEHCMCEKYPDFSDRNVSRIFNTCNKYTSYGFDLPDGLASMVNRGKAITLENCISKYGEVKGAEVYDTYCKKQSYKNTFECKREKYGWSKDDFDTFNKSRSVTLDNLVVKYGECKGHAIYENYVEKQRKTKSKEYVVDKYGELYWDELCKSKGCSVENFIKRYGDDGIKMYEDAIRKRIKFTSNISIRYFDNLVSFDTDTFCNLKCYYGKKNEFGFYSKDESRYYFIDFCVPSVSLAVEFNGNYFHANPKYHSSDDCGFWFTKKTAGEIWDEDSRKNSAIRKLGYTLFVVWEDDFDNDDIKNEIVKFVKKRRYELSI